MLMSSSIRLLRFVALLFLVRAICSHECFPQTYPTKLYTTADGLPQSSITCIFQDGRRNIWFGSWGGVARYDAKKFWSHQNSSMHVQSLCEDSTGTIWIGTYGLGIARVGRGDTSFTWLNKSSGELPSDNVLCLLRDTHNRLWIGTDKGLTALSPDGRMFRATVHSGLPNDQVNTLAEGRDGTIWVGTLKGFVGCKLDDSISVVTSVFASYAAILSMASLRNGDVLAGTYAHQCGVLRWREGRLDTLVYTNVPLKVMGILEDSRGMLWLGTSVGLKQVTNGHLQSIPLMNLPSSYIGALLEDHEGSIWCTSENGAIQLPTLLFKNYTMSTGLPGPQVISLYKDAERTLYLGTYKGACILPDSGVARTIDVSDGLPHNSVFAFCEVSHGEIWIGTNDGVRILSHGKLARTGIAELDNYPVYRIIKTKDGKIWCSSRGKVLLISGRRIEKTLREQEGIPDVSITVMYLDTSSRLWLGTENHGVGLYDGIHSVTWWTDRDGLPSKWIHSIAEDDRGTLWVATREGVTQWNGHTFEAIHTPEPTLKNTAVSVVIPGDSGRVWFGTQNGIYEWKDSIRQHLAYEDGLSADGVRCGMFSREGNLLVGTVGGLSQLDYSTYRHILPLPVVYVEGIKVDGNDGEYAYASKLRYDENTLTIGFNSRSFKNERQMSFQWMLAGFDRGWQIPQFQREVRYTHLPAGEYRFLVRAKNRGGQWSEPVAHAFVITPPFWERWWFRISVALAIIGFAALIYRRRIGALEAEKRTQQEFSLRLMESQENERKRIAGELHDSLGQNLLVIRNRALLGLKDADLSKQARDQLDQISSVATQAIDEVREISYDLRPYQLDRLGLTKAIQSITSGLASSVQFSMDVDFIDDTIEKDQAIHVYRIVQEAINNILKHAGATEASVVIRAEGNSVRMIISDNGKGMPATSSDSNGKLGFGLVGLGERAKVLSGAMTIDSTPGKGTTLTVIIPRIKKTP